MKKIARLHRFPLLLLLCLLLVSTALPVAANSALHKWTGLSSTGSILTGSRGPLQIEKELLTFDLTEFPKAPYTDSADFAAYSGKVTAEYTVLNPTDAPVTATLLFPFGQIPTYGSIYDQQGNLVQNLDAEKYGAFSDGKPLRTTLRHSFSRSPYAFDLQKDLALLSDSFRSTQAFTPNMPVTKYTFTVKGVEKWHYSDAHAALDIPKHDEATWFYLEGGASFKSLPDGNNRISAWVLNNGSQFTLYAIGNPPEKLPVWHFYKTGTTKDGDEIAGSMTLESTESMTLLELARNRWKAGSGISLVDWYNAMLSEMTTDQTDNLLFLTLFEQGFSQHLMQWYEYELSLAPGQRLVNRVTAPIYPDINGSKEPPVYTYTYLLSPANTWDKFGTLDIVINTPYYLTRNNLQRFTKTDTGYTLSLNHLPEDEFVFYLSASPHSKDNLSLFLTDFWGIILVLVPAVLIGGIFYFVNWLSKNKR